MKKSKLRKVSEGPSINTNNAGVVTLLLKDHKAMRELMSKVKSDRATSQVKVSSFKKLENLVLSHVRSEEAALLEKIKDHPKFKDECVEGIEEHEIHRNILAGIHQVTDKERRLMRMKIFCEMLEHHLDEEEEDLFPRFKKYAALSTRKKMGRQFLKKRKATHRPGEFDGAMKVVEAARI